MTYHRVQTQRDPDIEVLIPEASFAMGFTRAGVTVEKWVALPYGRWHWEPRMDYLLEETRRECAE